MPPGMVAWHDLGKPELMRELTRLATRVNTLERERSRLLRRVAVLEGYLDRRVDELYELATPDVVTVRSDEVVAPVVEIQTVDWEGGPW